MDEDLNILFSTHNKTYQEAIHAIRVHEDESASAKIMPDGKILKPIKVFEEGEFATVTRSGKPIKLVVDKARMEGWINNTTRDVPFNYDHKRESGPNELGWLRTRSSSVYLEQDRSTGKWGLFAQPELTTKLYNQVKDGQYRDISLEIDTSDEVIVGIAVTNYPRLKTLTQMSEIVDENTTQALKELALDATFQNYQALGTWYNNISEGEQELFSTNVKKIIEVKTQTQENTMDEAQVKAMMEAMKAELEAKYQKDIDNLSTSAVRNQEELDKLRKEKEEAERQAKRARTILGFSDKVDRLIAGENGVSHIPAGSRDDVIELFCYLSDHNEAVLFSELDDEKHVDPVSLLERILANQAKFSEVFGRVPEGNVARPVEQEDDGRMGEQLRNMFRAKSGFNKKEK